MTESNRLQGRVLGLDVGDRRIGVAISDPERQFALPLRSIERDRRASEFEAIGVLISEYEATEVVVGLPLSMSGESGAQAESSAAFAEDLKERFDVAVHLWDERLSTSEAIRRTTDQRQTGNRRASRKQSEADIDALAASIILQAFLDRQRLQEPASE